MVFVQKGATDFFGRAVSEDYVSVTTERTYCVAQWPFPRNRKDMDTFLGHINCHREHILRNFGSALIRSHKVKANIGVG